MLNKGPSAATNVIITDTLSSDVTFVSASTECSELNNTVTCNFSKIGNGSSESVSITVAPKIVGITNNQASVTNDITDPDITNNSASETTTVNKLVSGNILKGKIIDKPIASKDKFIIVMTNCEDIEKAVEDFQSKLISISIGTEGETPSFKTTSISGRAFLELGKKTPPRYIFKTKNQGKLKYMLLADRDLYKLVGNKINLDGIANPISVQLTIGQWGCISTADWIDKSNSKRGKFILKNK